MRYRDRAAYAEGKVMRAVDDNSLREHRRMLGLRANPTAEDVNAAFRRLSKDAHPDAGGSLDRFTDLQHARNELLDAIGDPDAALYVRAGGRRSDGSLGLVDRQPVWLPGAMATLLIGIVSAVVGIVQVDRQVLAIGLLVAIAVGAIITIALAAKRKHRT